MMFNRKWGSFVTGERKKEEKGRQQKNKKETNQQDQHNKGPTRATQTQNQEEPETRRYRNGTKKKRRVFSTVSASNHVYLGY